MCHLWNQDMPEILPKNVVLGMVSFITNLYANVTPESNLNQKKQTNFGYYDLTSKLLLTCHVQDVHGPS